MEIGFTGDVCFSGVFAENIRLGKKIFSDDLSFRLMKLDHVVVNLEGPETNLKNLSVGPRIVNELGSISYLSTLNVKNYNLCNNHIFDAGDSGFYETIDELKRNDCRYFGAYQSIKNFQESILYLERDNVKVALISVGCNGCKIADQKTSGVIYEKNFIIIKKLIEEAKRNSNWIILNYHGMEEYTFVPIPSKRKLLIKYLELGVDIVVAHHTHTLQGYEKINNKVIFYSLGNFIFDFEGHRNIENTDLSALLILKLLNNSYQFSFYPLRIDKEDGMLVEDERALEHIEKYSSFTHYWIKMLRDSYRTFYQPNVYSYNVSNVSAIRGRSESFFKIIFRLRSYKAFCKIMKSKMERKIYIFALIYKYFIFNKNEDYFK